MPARISPAALWPAAVLLLVAAHVAAGPTTAARARAREERPVDAGVGALPDSSSVSSSGGGSVAGAQRLSEAPLQDPAAGAAVDPLTAVERLTDCLYNQVGTAAAQD
jgi:hypothetical protein